MTSEWLREYINMPSSFTLTEQLDKAYLVGCLQSKVLNTETRAQVQRLFDRLPDDGLNVVNYSRNGKFGRWYPRQYGSTLMWRRVRAGALPDNYIDIDAVTSFPSCLVNLCKLHNVPQKDYEHIASYVENKTPYIESLKISDRDHRSVCRKTQDTMSKGDLGKLIINMQCYGAGFNAWRDIGYVNKKGNGVSPFPSSGLATKFRSQWCKLKDYFCGLPEYESIIFEAMKSRERKSTSYHNGCGLSMLLQSYESWVMHKLMDVFSNHVVCYEYDGLIIDLPRDDIARTLASVRLPLQFVIKGRSERLQTVESNILSMMIDSDDVSTVAPVSKSIEWSTDSEAAELILARYPNKFIVIDNEIYTRVGHMFRRSTISGMEPFMQTFITSLDMTFTDGKQEEKHRNMNGCKSIVSALKGLLLSDVKYHLTTKQVCEKFIGKMCFLDGVLDFNDKTFRLYTDTDIVIQAMTRPYCREFKQSTMDRLNTIFSCLDEPHRSWLIHLLTRGFTGHYADKFWIILTGPRNSGKGMLQEVFKLLDSYTSFVNAPIVGAETDQSRVMGTYMNAGGNLHGVMFSNEASSNTRTVAKLDGDTIKKIASGGDTQQSRVLYKDAVRCILTQILCACFNVCPLVQPEDALQNCHVFDMPYFYENDNPLLLQSPMRRYRDDSLKEWVNRDPDVFNALIQLMLNNYHWTGGKVNTSHIGIIDSNDKNSVFASRYILQPDGRVLMSDVQAVMSTCPGLSDNRALGKWLKKTFNITSSKRTIDGECNKYYEGLALNPHYDNDDNNEQVPDKNELILK